MGDCGCKEFGILDFHCISLEELQVAYIRAFNIFCAGLHPKACQVVTATLAASFTMLIRSWGLYGKVRAVQDPSAFSQISYDCCWLKSHTIGYCIIKYATNSLCLIQPPILSTHLPFPRVPNPSHCRWSSKLCFQQNDSVPRGGSIMIKPCNHITIS